MDNPELNDCTECTELPVKGTPDVTAQADIAKSIEEELKAAVQQIEGGSIN